MSSRAQITELRAALEQGIDLARQLDVAVFARALPPGRSGVGAHLRHVAGFVRAFLDGLETRRIDYDARERDERAERDPARGADVLQDLADELGALEGVDPAAGVRVRMDAHAGASPREGWQRSTLGRELVFLVSHTIHHYALVALALRQMGVEPAEEFGVAPATLAYWRSEAERCAVSNG